MDVNTKSTGQLVDELVTVSQRLWHAQDSIKTLSNEEAGKLAKAMLALNSQRNQLMRAISLRIDGQDSGSDKTY